MLGVEAYADLGVTVVLVRVAVAHELGDLVRGARAAADGARLPRVKADRSTEFDVTGDRVSVASFVQAVGGAAAEMVLEARGRGVGGQLDRLEVGRPRGQAVDVQFRVVVDDVALDAAGDSDVRVNRVSLGTKHELAAAVLVHVVGDVERSDGERVGAAVAVDLRLVLIGEDHGASLGVLVEEQGHNNVWCCWLVDSRRSQAGDERQAASKESEKHLEEGGRIGSFVCPSGLLVGGEGRRLPVMLLRERNSWSQQKRLYTRRGSRHAHPMNHSPPPLCSPPRFGRGIVSCAVSSVVSSF